MLVAYDDRLTEHLAGLGHPEQPDRVRVVARELELRGMLEERIDTTVAEPDQLARVHTQNYIELVRRECVWLEWAGSGLLSTGDTTIDTGSYDTAARAAGGTLAALEVVCAQRRSAFALVRPPGHHAEPARGMGFCVFNNAALAARTFSLETGGNALIADIDYHHGNGTQAFVEMTDNGLSYISTHAAPAYPGTGNPRYNHVGRGKALVNVPLPSSGIGNEAFIAIWTQALRKVARQMRPGLLVVSAGYDFVAGDPIGDLGIDSSAVRQIGRIVREIAVEYCDGRALFVLEGGYDPATLVPCVVETILGFEEGKDVDSTDEAAIPERQRAILSNLEAATARALV
jgi:acetoin utilization deacetylase AcuC-like enzyme